MIGRLIRGPEFALGILVGAFGTRAFFEGKVPPLRCATRWSIGAAATGGAVTLFPHAHG